MMNKKILNCYISLLFLFLVGCNGYNIETHCDESLKTQVCSLKNHLLKIKPGCFSGKLELNLDKIDNESVLALFSLSNINKNAFIKPQTSIIFILINKNKNREKIVLTPLYPPQNKSSQEPIYLFMHSIGYVGVLPSTEQTISSVKAYITREQLIKISEAEKILFSLETIEKPIKGEWDAENLQPLRELVETCFSK